MLKYLKFLMLLVLPFSLAMTLTSCSDDDNEVNDEETSLLVGSWEWDDEVEPEIWTFNANGTCKRAVYWVGDPSDVDIDTGKYRYDSSTQILLISWDGQTLTDKYKVLSISSLELILQEDDGYTITFNRKI